MRRYITILILCFMLILALCMAGPSVAWQSDAYINPDAYLVPKDGVTDSTAAWETMLSNIAEGSTIIVPANADYYLNTSGGLVFSKTVTVIGGATFTGGPNIGNSPVLTFEGDGSKLCDFKVDCSANHTDGNDSDFEDETDSFLYNNRCGILITGDRVTCDNVDVYQAVFGIAYSHADNGNVLNCYIHNTAITYGVALEYNNYHAGILFYYSDFNTVRDCTVEGHGQNILVSCSFDLTIDNNRLSGASNNSIYGSSGNSSIICNNRISTFDNTGIKARGSYHEIHNNKVHCDAISGANIGIGVTGRGTGDADGYNGYGTIVSFNEIDGDCIAAIRVSSFEGAYFKDVSILDNTIRLLDSPVGSAYGIQFYLMSADGARLCRNHITGGFTYGLLLSPDTGRIFTNMMITNNSMIGSNHNTVVLSEIYNSFIHGNVGKNSNLTSRSALVIAGSGNIVSDNHFGNDDYYQSKGIEEVHLEGEWGNWYIDNFTYGTIYPYYDVDTNISIIVDPNQQ